MITMNIRSFVQGIKFLQAAGVSTYVHVCIQQIDQQAISRRISTCTAGEKREKKYFHKETDKLLKTFESGDVKSGQSYSFNTYVRTCSC